MCASDDPPTFASAIAEEEEKSCAVVSESERAVAVCWRCGVGAEWSAPRDDDRAWDAASDDDESGSEELRTTPSVLPMSRTTPLSVSLVLCCSEPADMVAAVCPCAPNDAMPRMEPWLALMMTWPVLPDGGKLCCGW